MRDGIVNEFYWVIPGDIGEFKKCLGILKKLLRDLKKEDPCPVDAPPLIQPGFIKSRLYGRPFYITILETLPRLKRSVLLDIDTDFFVIESLRRADATCKLPIGNPGLERMNSRGYCGRKFPSPDVRPLPIRSTAALRR